MGDEEDPVGATTSRSTESAAAHGMVSCRACGLLCRSLPPAAAMRCPRCQGALHVRKPHSIAQTWFFLLAATILYVPANILPILETHALSETQGNTIMHGVTLFWN